MNKLVFILFVFCMFLFTSGCENSNIFSWSHSEGKVETTDALLIDGQKALLNDDYDAAIEYYSKILESDPDNSEALYGLAAAELKDAGLDLSELLPKFLNETDSSLSSVIFGAANRRSQTGVDDLIPLLNYSKLEEATEVAVESLQTIVSGKADGTIPSDDIDVNINLAVAKVVHAASYLLNKYSLVTINEDFNVTGYQNITAADKNLAISEIESAIDENLAIVLKNTDIDIDDVKKGFETFKTQINQ